MESAIYGLFYRLVKQLLKGLTYLKNGLNIPVTFTVTFFIANAACKIAGKLGTIRWCLCCKVVLASDLLVDSTSITVD